MYVYGTCFYVCCSECVGVCGNVCCVAAVVKDCGFLSFGVLDDLPSPNQPLRKGPNQKGTRYPRSVKIRIL